ncbi:hypothetical protein HanRHA438_Chr05g0221541 [Helianthus annuus]|nr:hypothetical protein HanIR_Chr05g0228281 [Helianthus annuus]KAJ0918747.1 hypothetical protein HanRHA438_Chr05g0221541 [Helianthus annuus]
MLLDFCIDLIGHISIFGVSSKSNTIFLLVLSLVLVLLQVLLDLSSSGKCAQMW